MIELVKVEESGPGGLFGVARQLHWRARVAAAERRAFRRIWQIEGIPKEVNRVRDEMIVFLKDELAWSTSAIAETYQLSQGTVRKVLSRCRAPSKKPI